MNFESNAHKKAALLYILSQLSKTENEYISPKSPFENELLINLSKIHESLLTDFFADYGSKSSPSATPACFFIDPPTLKLGELKGNILDNRNIAEIIFSSTNVTATSTTDDQLYRIEAHEIVSSYHTSHLYSSIQWVEVIHLFFQLENCEANSELELLARLVWLTLKNFLREDSLHEAFL